MGGINTNKNQISRIKIKGFKSIKDADIDLGMLNIFIGPNGAGKSNFISLFILLQELIESRLQNYISLQGGPDSILYFSSKETDYIQINIKFCDNEYGFQLAPTQLEKMMFVDEWFTGDITISNLRHTNHTSVGRGQTESLWKRSSMYGVNSYIQSVFEKHKFRVYHFHDTSNTARLKKLGNLNNNVELAVDAGNLAAFLYRLKENDISVYTKIVKTIRLVAPFFNDFVLLPDRINQEMIRLEWKNFNSDVIFNAFQLSDGTLRFICLATLLLQPYYLSSDTMIIDEPELGLHPYAIKLLASMIKSVSLEKQIIISTQSVELLNEFDVENIIIADRKNNASVFNRLSEDDLRVWLEEDYSLGELWQKNLLGGRPSV